MLMVKRVKKLTFWLFFRGIGFIDKTKIFEVEKGGPNLLGRNFMEKCNI